jgi:hypothetical protein
MAPFPVDVTAAATSNAPVWVSTVVVVEQVPVAAAMVGPLGTQLLNLVD